jgi:hypothetical protein
MFKVTFRPDQCRLRANIQTLKPHTLRVFNQPKLGKRERQAPFGFSTLLPEPTSSGASARHRQMPNVPRMFRREHL